MLKLRVPELLHEPQLKKNMLVIFVVEIANIGVVSADIEEKIVIKIIEDDLSKSECVKQAAQLWVRNAEGVTNYL